MKKCLVISWYFPPVNSSEGLVTFKLLKNSKYKYDVFTQKGNESWTYGSKEDKLVSSNINTIFAKNNELSKWVEEGIQFFDDNKDKYDMIMSRSMAPESHMIALAIKKKYPDIKWIASFGDPISNNPYVFYNVETNPYTIRGKGIENLSFRYVFSPKRIIKDMIWTIRRKRYLRKFDPEKKNIKLQSETLLLADKVILNNEYQKEHMLKTSPKKEEVEKKIIVIPHTFDKDFYEKKTTKKNDKIKFAYLGHLDKIRSPHNFLKALSRLKSENPSIGDELSVEFYGNISDDDKVYILDEEMYDFVKIKKPVTYFESLKIMQESDWLLLIDANLSNILDKNIFFAAKISDYLGAGSNIFGVTMLEGPSADILRETNSVLSSYSSDEIYMYLKLILEGKCPYKTNNQSHYDIVNVVGKYDEMVKELINR